MDIMESHKGLERCSNALGSKLPLVSIDPLLITVYVRIFSKGGNTLPNIRSLDSYTSGGVIFLDGFDP